MKYHGANHETDFIYAHLAINRLDGKPNNAVCFDEHYNHDLSGIIEQFDSEYADYLIRRPWNNRVGNWTQLVADFYRDGYNHYSEIPALLTQQGFADR